MMKHFPQKKIAAGKLDILTWIHLLPFEESRAAPTAQNVLYSNLYVSPWTILFNFKKKWCSSIIDSLPRQKLYIFKPKKYFKEMRFHSNKPFPRFSLLGQPQFLLGPLFSLTTAFGGARGARNLSEDAVAKGFGISISKSHHIGTTCRWTALPTSHYSGPVVFLGRWKKMCKLLTIL